MAVSSEIKRGKGGLCSLGCAAAKAGTIRDSRGAANGNWKGGVSQVASRIAYKTRHPEKHAAHLAMTRAIRQGILKRQPCENCGKEKVEGHHDDYAYPLAVRWLCKRHHLEAHRGRFGRVIMPGPQHY